MRAPVIRTLALGAAATALAAAASFTPVTALACSRNLAPASGDKQACLFWPNRRIPVWVNAAGTVSLAGDAFAAARRSLATWSSASGVDLRLVDAGLTTDSRVGFFAQGGLNVNQVTWRRKLCTDMVPASDACWTEGGCGNKYTCWEATRETIAVTTTTFNNRCGDIFDGDIELNDTAFYFTAVDSSCCPMGQPAPNCVATDVENAVTHELGHLIGLDHSDVQDATMYPSAPWCDTGKRSLHADDLVCLREMYPPGKPTPICGDCSGRLSTGCCGGGAAGSAAVPWLLVGVAVAPCGTARRRWP